MCAGACGAAGGEGEGERKEGAMGEEGKEGAMGEEEKEGAMGE